MQSGKAHLDLNDGPCLPLPGLTEAVFSSQGSSVKVLTDEILYGACKVRIAFTLRCGGISSPPFEGLNLSYTVGDSPDCVRANRRMLLDCLDVSKSCDTFVNPVQVHGCDLLCVDDVKDANQLEEVQADGVVCIAARVGVLLCFADCVPVIIVAPNGAFAVAHAGWRGALAGIPGLALEQLVKATNCLSADCNVYIGPHIGACCYEVGSDVLQEFVKEYGNTCEAFEGHLDLLTAVTASVLRAGAAAARVFDIGHCTSCLHDCYYSYRFEGGTCGRHGAFALRCA